jgi:hypothetical protein
MSLEPKRPIDPAVAAVQAGKVVAERIARSVGRSCNDNRGHSSRAPPADDEADKAGALAMSIAEFCRRHNISPSFYFKLQQLEIGPRTMKVGGRTLISREAAADWRHDREAAAEGASETNS